MHKKCKKGAVSEWEAEMVVMLFFCLSRALFFRLLAVFVVNICKNLHFQSGFAVVYLFGGVLSREIRPLFLLC